MAPSSASPRPLLVLVSGKPGAGKSTLARRLAATDTLGLPLLERDAIKVGLVTTHGLETDELRATIVPDSFDIFYQTMAAWLRAGVSLIAEQSFRRGMAESDLRPLTHLACAVVLHCDTSPAEAQRRFIARERSNPRARPDLLAATIERMEQGTYDWAIFDPLDLDVPTLRVDTTDSYTPGLDTITAFCRNGQAGEGGGDACRNGVMPPLP